MIIASGTSSRHLQALSEILVSEMKKIGLGEFHIEGRESSDWKLVDANDIIVHIFHPEKDDFMIWKKCGQRKFLKKKQQYEKNYFLFFILLILPLFMGNQIMNSLKKLIFLEKFLKN